jgi:4-hydroxy-3-polyprenylbenzoate decarboxylase
MEKINNNPPALLAVTGASGSIYALSIARLLSGLNQEFHVIFSKTGKEVTEFELGLDGYNEIKNLSARQYNPDDFFAPPSSGSSFWKAMVIIPCTMGTLGSIANGISNNLIHRSADCFLKERRPLVLAVRETPFNRNHLLNMLKVQEAGGVIFPAMPGFYHKPLDLDEMAMFFAKRLLQFIGFEIKDMKTWEGLQI